MSVNKRICHFSVICHIFESYFFYLINSFAKILNLLNSVLMTCGASSQGRRKEGI